MSLLLFLLSLIVNTLCLIIPSWPDTIQSYFSLSNEYTMKSKKILVSALLMLSAIATPALSKSWTDVDYVGDGMVGHKMDIHVPDDGKATHKVIF